MVTAGEAEAIAEGILGSRLATVVHLPVGFGSHNWRVVTEAGSSYLLKVGPPDSAAKWTAARRAHDLAADAGVPVSPLVHFAADEHRVVQLFEWIEAVSVAAIAHDPSSVARLGTELATALAAMHSIELGAFSSRLDGSAPAFARWFEYVRYRLPQIRARSVANGALDATVLDRVCDDVEELAVKVSDVARATLCHRDLHPDNLLVDETGRLLAILDWDMAEAWDPAGEWCKLAWMLLPALPGGEDVFTAVYRGANADVELWDERTRLVDLMETLNALANAAGHPAQHDYEDLARTRLANLMRC